MVQACSLTDAAMRLSRTVIARAEGPSASKPTTSTLLVRTTSAYRQRNGGTLLPDRPVQLVIERLFHQLHVRFVALRIDKRIDAARKLRVFLPQAVEPAMG